MQTEFDADNRRLDLVFENEDELHRYLEKLQRSGLFLVRLPEAPQAKAHVSVRLRGGDTEISVESEVHQVFRSGAAEHGVALRPLTEIPGPRAAAEATSTDESAEATPEVTVPSS